MRRLQNKTALVTGAAQGIGKAIVERFLREGARVIATDLDPGRFDLEPSANLSLATLDVTDEAAVAKIFADHADVDVLVNCAGFVASGNALECTAQDFDRSLEINVRSVYLTVSGVLPSMVERRSGSIVNIASVVSSVMAAPNRFAYATSKAALIGLTMSVAKDFASHGIRCNAISPGTVDTPSLRARLSVGGDYEGARQAFVARQSLGRLGVPEEIAAVATLLASDEAGFMTGSNVVVDGGMSL